MWPEGAKNSQKERNKINHKALNEHIGREARKI